MLSRCVSLGTSLTTADCTFGGGEEQAGPTSNSCRTMRRLVTCGDGYLGQQDERIHFGLGEATTGDLTVRWPDGTEQTYKGLTADAVHEISREKKGA